MAVYTHFLLLIITKMLESYYYLNMFKTTDPSYSYTF